MKVIGSFGASPQEGAKTSIYPASSPKVEGITGNYFVKSIPKQSAAISYEPVPQTVDEDTGTQGKRISGLFNSRPSSRLRRSHRSYQTCFAGRIQKECEN